VINNALFSLEGKTALVTGATFGIGQAICKALAEAGASLIGVSSSGQFAQTAELVGQAGRSFRGITADLASTAGVDDVVSEMKRIPGGIDILVNNAGIIRRAPSIDASTADWDDVMNVNLRSAFLLAQAGARDFVTNAKAGKIINICSMLSFQGGLMVASYAASKSALAGLTRALANEWARHSINVNAIAPGYIRGRGNAALRDDPERNRQILERIPAGRWGEPEDLAGMAIFLASRASDYCHGGIYSVDGGWLAR
jgi:2-dehydro-3-deoxy-D-gluconate 5-dehydrogenase